MSTTMPFPGRTVILLGDTTHYEPSGLVLVNGNLYMASDDGYIYLYSNLDNTWKEVLDDNGSDFESITYAKKKLMVGIEEEKKPKIARLAMNNDGTLQKTSSWILELPNRVKLGDMEAMTFVPEEYCPFGKAKHYGGFFFVAFQSCLGKIFVYDLPKGDGKTDIKGNKSIHTYEINIHQSSSDMCFANGALYVLFDDNSNPNMFAVYTTHRKSKKLTYQKQYGLPLKNGSQSNYEGIAISGQTIYLARDDNNHSNNNAVYCCPSTSVFPQE